MLIRIILFCFVFCAVQLLYAQVDEYGDVVTLTNGAKVVGKITENVPNDHVTIMTRGGSTFTFKADQVQSTTRQNSQSVYRTPKLTDYSKRGAELIPPSQKDTSSETGIPKSGIKGEPAAISKTSPRGYSQIGSPRYPQSPVEIFSLRFDVEGGYSYRTAKVSDDIPADFKNYVEELKSGYNIGANISYYFSEEYGICLNYSRFMTSNSIDGVTVYDIGTGDILGIGKMEDNVNISFYGIGLAGRHIFSGGKIIFIGNFSLGSASYFNDAKLLNKSYEIEGSTFAYSGSVNLDFMLEKNWALGLGISYLGGTIKNATLNGESVDLGEENLFRLDFNIGVKYYY